MKSRSCAAVFTQLLKNKHDVAIASQITETDTSLKDVPMIECTLKQVYSGQLSIEKALSIYIELFDAIVTGGAQIAYDKKYPFIYISQSHMAEYIVYFIVSVILMMSDTNKANHTFLTNAVQAAKRERNNALLQVLLDAFIPHLPSHCMKLEYIPDKTMKIKQSVSLFTTDVNCTRIITQYMGCCAMNDLIEFVIYFMHYAQYHSYFRFNRYYDNRDIKYNHQNYTEFNSVPQICFEIYYSQHRQNMLCNSNRQVMWNITRILFAILIENKERHQHYGTELHALEALANRYHLFPFHKDPQFWMNVIRDHCDDNEHQISLCFRRIFSCAFMALYNGRNVGFNLFAPCGYIMGYESYLRERIDYGYSLPNYDYIYQHIVCKYILNSDWSATYDADLSVFRWFIRDCIGYFMTLWHIQAQLYNYSVSDHATFVSFFVKCIDHKQVIEKINTLYPASNSRLSSLILGQLSAFANEMCIFTLDAFFNMVLKAWNEKRQHYNVWKGLVTVIYKNGWDRSICMA